MDENYSSEADARRSIFDFMKFVVSSGTDHQKWPFLTLDHRRAEHDEAQANMIMCGRNEELAGTLDEIEGI